MARRVTGPWNAAALPEIMAGPFRKASAVRMAVADRGAAGQQPGSVAGARGSGTAEAKARPNAALRGGEAVPLESTVRGENPGKD